MSTVARQEQTRDDHDAGTGERQPDDEVPRRRGMAERAGEAVPEPALEVVHEGQEDRGKKRRRNPDHRAEADESQKLGAAEVRRKFVRRHGIPTLRRRATPRQRR
jgi:hypothetical protein